MKVIPPITISNTEGSFTRSTTATYVGNNGRIQTAAVNTPRVQYNPVTLICQGVLYEPARTNLITYSEQFDNAAWNKSNVTITSNSNTAPDGNSTADTLSDNTTNAEHILYMPRTGSNETLTASVYLKAGTKDKAYLGFSNFSNASCTVQYNLSLGTIVYTSGNSIDYTNISGTITDSGSGWYRCTITATKGSVNTINNICIVTMLNGSSSYIGDGLASMYVWGAQAEIGSFVTSYIPTVASVVPRGADTFTGSTPCLVYSNVADTGNLASQIAWVSGNAYAAGTKVYRATTNCVYQCIKDITTGTTNATILPEASVLLDIPYWVRLDALPWASGTTYTYSAISPVQVTYNNRTYEIIATTTVNTTLPTSTSPTYWFDVGPSNRWGVFDYLRNSTSNIKTQMVISVSTGTRVDSLVLVGMQDIKNAVVTVYSPSLGTTTYTTFRSLTTKASATWYDYFFTAGTTVKSAVFSNLLPYSDAIVSIVITGDNIACGGIILGKAQELGTIQRGATSEIINFSTVTRDIFGNATMVQRRNIPKTNQTLYLDKSYVNAVRIIRDQLNATPAAWVGLEDLPDQYYFESLLIVGFYRTFTINIDNPIGVIINLELEEI